MKANDEIIVTIEKFDHQGRGIAHAFGKTIFVVNAIPEEQVKIKVTKVKNKIAEAYVIEVIQSSPLRVTPPCPYYEKCGGCDLMHVSYEEQLRYKENKVRELMTRYAGLKEDVLKPIMASETPFNYRNKVTFQVKETIGFYQKKSYEIIPIDTCIISDEKINQVLSILKHHSLPNIDQIIVRSSKYTEESMVVLDTNGPISTSFMSELQNIVTSIVEKRGFQYHTLYGKDFIHEKLGDYYYKISPSSFFQVNTDQALKLYRKVEEYVSLTGNETVLDLYCGTGSIGIFISAKAKEVLGIELNSEAVENANENKERNHVSNISFLAGDVSKLIDQVAIKPDVVVVDPPRAGLDSHTIDILKKLSPKRMVYVSCDPMTLARDLKLLQEEYEVLEVTPVDMFSETQHVECVCALSKK